MTMTPALQALLAKLPPGQDLHFTALLDALYTTRYTGPVTFDFRNGTPQQINLGQPVKLSICHGSGGGLDTGKQTSSG